MKGQTKYKHKIRNIKTKSSLLSCWNVRSPHLMMLQVRQGEYADETDRQTDRCQSITVCFLTRLGQYNNVSDNYLQDDNKQELDIHGKEYLPVLPLLCREDYNRQMLTISWMLLHQKYTKCSVVTITAEKNSTHMRIAVVFGNFVQVKQTLI